MKILKKILIAFFTIIGIFVICAIIFNYHCSSAQPNFKPVPPITAEEKAASDGIEDYSRPVASTYLTFPEWYLVFNPQEYAQFLSNQKPSGFPYFSSIGQF